MALRTLVTAKAGLRGHVELARLLKLSDKDFGAHIRDIEADPFFSKLRTFGVVSLTPYPHCRFSSRRFSGLSLKDSGDDFSELLDGNGRVAELMRRIGQENFEENFLRADGVSDIGRAKACGIEPAEAALLREFLDRMYVREEFASAPQAAPTKTYSVVAGIELAEGRPVLGFFHRDVWKARYKVDRTKLTLLRGTIPDSGFRRLEALLRRLELIEKRNTTLYRLLEAILELQAEFLLLKKPGMRRALTQRALAARVEVVPSVLSRLISNKAVQLPWGLEVPLKTLIPTSKALLKDDFYQLAIECPDASDETLRMKLESRGVKLSRRSIAQYRKELGLGAGGNRQKSSLNETPPSRLKRVDQNSKQTP